MTALYIIAGLIIAVCICFVLMIKPSCRRYEMPCDVFAHRGLHNGRIIPENSEAAFIKAHDGGFGVELDVQYTKDKKIVVFHDNNIKRVCGEDLNVYELTYEQLLRYGLYDTSEKIPLFTEVLKIMDGLPIVCEIKTAFMRGNEELCEEVAGLISEYNGKILLESFNPYVVSWFKTHRPNIIRGQLSANFAGENAFPKNIMAWALKNLLVNFMSKPDFIAYDFTADSFGYKLCRRLYRPVCIAWTPRGGKQMEKAKEKYKYIIFEQQETAEKN